MFKKLLTLSLIVLFVAGLSLGCAPKETGEPAGDETESTAEKTAIDIYTFRAGTSPYAIGIGLADLINQHSSLLKATAIEGNPTVNAKILLEEENCRKNTFVFGTPITIFEAANAIPPFDQASGDLRAVTLMTLRAGGLISIDPEVRTLQDLEGKRVGLGPAPSLMRVDIPQKIIENAGVAAQIEIIDLPDQLTSLKDGVIAATLGDVYMLSYDPLKYIVSPEVTELMATHDVYFIPFDEAATEQALKELGNPPTYPIAIPAGVLAPTQEEPWPVLYNTVTWMVHKDMPDEIVYEFLNVYYEHAAQFKEFHTSAEIVTAENLGYVGVGEEYIHPAALQFFKDKGIETGFFK